MSQKINNLIVRLFLVTFLRAFIVVYKNSGKIFESIGIAILWSIVTVSSLSARAKSIIFLGADGFTPLAKPRFVNINLGLFNKPKTQNQNLSSDKPGGKGSNNHNI